MKEFGVIISGSAVLHLFGKRHDAEFDWEPSDLDFFVEWSHYGKKQAGF